MKTDKYFDPKKTQNNAVLYIVDQNRLALSGGKHPLP